MSTGGVVRAAVSGRPGGMAPTAGRPLLARTAGVARARSRECARARVSPSELEPGWDKGAREQGPLGSSAARGCGLGGRLEPVSGRRQEERGSRKWRNWSGVLVHGRVLTVAEGVFWGKRALERTVAALAMSIGCHMIGT